MSQENNEVVYEELCPYEEKELTFEVVDHEKQVEVSPLPSNPCIVAPDSVQIHLLRYALYQEGRSHSGKSLEREETDHLPNPPAENKPEESYKYLSPDRYIGKRQRFSPENAPEVHGYRYYGAPIREGWLYVYNETRNKWYEYKIFPGGELQVVKWKRFRKGYDEREPQPKAAKLSCLKVPVDQVVWLAYSEVQWTSEYTSEVMKKEQMRTVRMQRIDCGEWLATLSGPDLQSVAQVSIETVEYSGTHQVSYDIYARHYQLCKALDNNEHHLYAYLHDPLGAADDVAEDLSLLHAQFDALVASLSGGSSKEAILAETLRELQREEHIPDNDQEWDWEEDFTDTPATEEQQQYRDLFSSALILYQMLFAGEGNTKDAMKNYRSYIHKDKLLALLGEKERRDLHASISGTWDATGKKQLTRGVRDALGILLFSNYYQNIWLDYKDNTPERILQGQTRCALQLNLMAINGYVKDKFLSLTSAAIPEDPWKEKLYEAFYYLTENPPEEEALMPKTSGEALQYVCRPLLYRNPDTRNAGKSAWCEIEKKVDLADKVGIAYRTVVDFALQVIDYKSVGPRTQMIALNREYKQLGRKLDQLIERADTKKEMFVTKAIHLEEEIDKLTEKIGKLKHPTKSKKNITLQKYKREYTDLIASTSRSQNVYRGKMKNMQKAIGTTSEKLGKIKSYHLVLRTQARFISEKLANNRYVKRLMLGLNLFNLVNAGRNTVEKTDEKELSNVVAIALELSSLVLSQFRTLDYKLGRQVATKYMAPRVAVGRATGLAPLRLSVQLSWVAGGFSAVVTAMDSYDSFKEGDTNTGIAYGISAAAGLTVIGASVAAKTIAGATGIAGPVGGIAAVIGLAALGIALWLRDDDLQVFLHATVLSNEHALPGDINTAQAAQQYLYKNCVTFSREYSRPLCNTNRIDIDMSNFSHMLEWLYNMLTNITLEIKYLPNLRSITLTQPAAGYSVSKQLDMSFVYALDLRCRFSHAKPGRSYFDYFLIIFPYPTEEPLRFHSLEDISDSSLPDQIEEAHFTNPIRQDSNQICLSEMHFHWQQDIQDLIDRRSLGTRMRFIFGCRLIIDEENKEFWPFSRDNQPRYFACYGPLMFSRETTQSSYFFNNYNKYLLKNYTMGTKEEVINNMLNIYKL